ncbi:MAG: hypothetical protein ACP5UU_03625 [Thermoprotei archaeon]
MRWKDIWVIAGKVYEELMFQGYFASRLTGLSPTDKVASRSVRNAKLYKYFMSALYGGMMLITVPLGSVDKAYLPATPITVFFWVYILVFISAFQISFSVSSSPHIRNFLSTLPLDYTEMQLVSALSILRAVDAPIAVSLAVPLIVGAFFGSAYALNFFISSISGISLALATDVMLSYGFRKVSIGSKASGLLRAGSIVPVVLLAGVAFDVPTFIVGHWKAYFSLVPVLDLYWINATSVVASVVYAVVFASLAVYGFSRQAVYLLVPEEYVGKAFAGDLNIRPTGRTFAIIRLDLRQATRSRLASLLSIPLIYFALALVAAISTRSLISQYYLLFWGSYIIPTTFASAMLAYALYASEERGLSTLITLPISKLQNMLSKCVVTMGTYGLVSLLMSALMVYNGKPSYALPVILMEFPLMASVAFAGYYFDKVFKGGGAGMASSATALLFALGVILIISVPSGIFLAVAYVSGNVVTASIALPLASLIEMAPFIYALREDRNRYKYP